MSTTTRRKKKVQNKQVQDHKDQKPLDFDILNQFTRSYIDIQKTKVGMDLRCQKLEQHELVKRGLATKKETIIKDENGNEKRSYIITVTGTKDEVKEALERFRTESDEFKTMLVWKNRLAKDESDLLEQATGLFARSNLWKWCQSVRGLGPAAAMMFIGYINPDKADTVQKMWSYLGLTPNKSRKKGQQAKFNPQAKGRILGVTTPNLIRSNDPYYAEIYRIKKDYYRQRPDILLMSKKPGFNAHTDKMSKRNLAKIVVSHAFELLQRDRGMNPEPIANRHRNPLPIKSNDEKIQKMALAEYKKGHDVMLKQLNKLWKAGDRYKYDKFLKSEVR